VCVVEGYVDIESIVWIVVGCLKLLPPEELEHLDILERKDSGSPVKRVVYLTDTDVSVGEMRGVRGNGTRFNLFTGNQTFAERENSFQVMIW